MQNGQEISKNLIQTTDKRDFLRFGRIFLILFLGIVLGAVAFIVWADPFYQYHAPFGKMPIILDNAVYQTPGAARNLEYRDAVVGTSMTENFHTSWFDEEMGWQTMKLSYSGARSDDLKAIFAEIFSGERQVGHIFMDINDYQLTEPAWTAYVVRPSYLYDDNVLNDWEYVLNREVLETGYERLLDMAGGVGDNVDSAYTWEESELFGAEITRSTARDIREQLLANPPTDAGDDMAFDGQAVTWRQGGFEEELALCQENLDNILPYVKEHPDTEFIVFFPPYSMLYWEEKLLSGKLDTMFAIYKYAADTLLKCENVRVFYFQDEREIMTNLDNYRDTCHHRPEYNRYIFECVRDGKKELTAENVEETMQALYEFVRDYDYSVFWGE